MAKNEKTSPRIAKIASRLLRNPKTPKDIKSIAGSDLTQAPDKKKTKQKSKKKKKTKKKN